MRHAQSDYDRDKDCEKLKLVHACQPAPVLFRFARFASASRQLIVEHLQCLSNILYGARIETYLIATDDGKPVFHDEQQFSDGVSYACCINDLG